MKHRFASFGWSCSFPRFKAGMMQKLVISIDHQNDAMNRFKAFGSLIELAKALLDCLIICRLSYLKSHFI